MHTVFSADFQRPGGPICVHFGTGRNLRERDGRYSAGGVSFGDVIVSGLDFLRRLSDWHVQQRDGERRLPALSSPDDDQVRG
mmetsp:Transcript_9384/g.38470  ORF Transcript_9384/g.38470 Transcript_9384/m.38470 type:complete len:82 (+) Transcript_9384:2119-2364(+)